MTDNLYSKEFRMYMEYALLRFLTEKQGLSEEEAKLKVAQEYDEVYASAKEAGFI